MKKILEKKNAKSKKFEKDFGKSRQLNNAMNLTAEFHNAKDKKFQFDDFRKVRDIELGNLINKNVVF